MKWIFPVLPTMPPYPLMPLSPQIALSLLFVCLAVPPGWAMERYLQKRFHRPMRPFNMLAPVLSAALLAGRFGVGLHAARGLIFFFLLLFAANSDRDGRSVDDSVPIMIFVAALIGISGIDLLSMGFAALVIGLILLCVALLNPGRWGGADVKVTTACAFLLGTSRGLCAVILAVGPAVAITALKYGPVGDVRRESFRLIPFLAAAAFAAYLI